METIHHITTPAGKTYEIEDTTAREQTFEIEDTTAREQTFEPMDNYEINDILTDIFD